MMAKSTSSPQSGLLDSINELKTGVADIKADICLKLSVSNFTKVTVANIKSSQKLVKQNTAEHLLTILKLSDNVCKMTNISDCSLNFVDTDSIKNLTESITSTIDDKLRSIVDNSLSGTLTTIIGRELEKLQKFKDELYLLKQQDDAQDDQTPLVEIEINTPEPAIKNYYDNFINTEDHAELCDFLTKIEYHRENGHDVKNFGEQYDYSGSADKVSQAIPPIISKHIDKIKKLGLGIDINECLINRYKNGDSFLSSHSDDELAIDPESSIYCLSLGQERGIVFKNKFSGDEETHIANDHSLYVMTRTSQAY